MTLEQELAAGMREHTTGLRLSPAVLAKATRRHRRRRIVIRTSAGAATLAVAAAVTAVVAAPGAVAPTVTGVAPPTRTVGYVTTQVAAVLTADQSLIMHVTTTVSPSANAHGQSWSDPTTQALRSVGYAADGHTPTKAIGVQVSNGQSVVTLVDYDAHTWSSQTQPDGGGKPFAASWDPAQTRAGLADGTVVLVGPVSVNGVSTLHLRLDGDQELWVDQDTYQVVRWVGHKATADGTLTIQSDIEWLPRTPANLDLVRLTPPAGFTRTP